MTEKTIKSSRRGLTFSFPSEGKLAVGNHYDYIIERAPFRIRIVAAEDGRYKMSRKRSGTGWNSLVDLRSRDVLDAIAAMQKISIHIGEDEILVSDACAKAAVKVIHFPRSELSALRMAAGLDDWSAVNSVLDYAQITLDEYLASREPVSIQTVQKDLADVYTMVSLFSGAGILDWPFAKDDRFRILYAIDYDAAACETYRKNIGIHIVHGDIHRAFTKNGYPLDTTVKAPDVLIGGPSCKPFSQANRHTRLADHPDNDLVVQYMRILKVLQPKVFAMENVPEILTASGGAYFAAIQEAAHESGYSICAKIVQDNMVGGYTKRRRAVVLGSRVGQAVLPNATLVSGSHTAGEALSLVDQSWTNFSDVTLPNADTKRRMSFVPQGGNYKDIPPEYRTSSKNRHSCTYRRLAWDEPSPTIVNWRKPPLIHPLENRTLTVAEAKALQGLPGDFRICGSLGQKQQQVGNSVPVAIGRYIKNAVLRALRSIRKPGLIPCAVGT